MALVDQIQHVSQSRRRQCHRFGAELGVGDFHFPPARVRQDAIDRIRYLLGREPAAQ